jgi:uncharacterized protein DUF4258
VKRTIDKLRELVRLQDYGISTHANEEMSNDELRAIDVENAILTGKIVKRFTRDVRGTRYEVLGEACDNRPIAVVCRILQTGHLIIITVYALQVER